MGVVTKLTRIERENLHTSISSSLNPQLLSFRTVRSDSEPI